MMAHMNQGPSTNPSKATPPMAAMITNLCNNASLVRSIADDNTQGGKY